MAVLSTMMIMGILSFMKYEKETSTMNNCSGLDVTEGQTTILRISSATEMSSPRTSTSETNSSLPASGLNASFYRKHIY